ncbi:MAG: hypothetical protein ABUT20_28620 [Bacteroidota bacterium]
MEVHAHSHTPRKKWTHYLWEFLMLFLAVFCGFMAENQREHMIEHQREKKYIQNLIHDLTRDTTNFNLSFYIRLEREKQAYQLITMLTSPNKNKQLKDIYYFARLMSLLNIVFTPSNATMQQLKNSGALRLIKDNKIADCIVAYDVAIEKYVSTQQAEINIRTEYRNDLGNVFDAGVLLSMIDTSANDFEKLISSPENSKPLITEDKQTINHLCTLVHYIYSSSVLNRKTMLDLKEQAIRLIALLKKEYHLK